MKNALVLTLFFVIGTSQLSFAGKYADIIKEFYLALDAGNFEKATSYLSDDIQASIPFSHEPYNLEGYKQIGMGMKVAFPNMKHQVVESVESKGACAFQGWISATNTGPLMGNPPTGNTIEMPYQGFVKFNKDKKIVEMNIQFDLLAFNTQLMKGITPIPNKATELVNKFFKEVVGNKHQHAMLDNLLAPEFTSAFPAPNSTREEFIDGIKGVLMAFPDIRTNIVHQSFEGNKVFTHGYWEATNTGSFMGMPATGKRVHVAFMDIWTEAGDKLVKNEVVMDIAGLMTQLGDPIAAARERNLATVKNIYAAFGNSDLPALLGHLSDDIVWTDAGTGVGDLHIGTRRGKAAVTAFFKELGNSIIMTDFKVYDYVANEKTVIANGHYSGKAKTSGKQISTDFSMTWEFDQMGKVIRHHLYLDTDNVAKALAGVNNNLASARMAYQDFLAGNVDGILSGLSENIVWMHAGDSRRVPFAGTFKGKDQVQKFFKSVNSNVEIIAFEPFDFMHSGNTVTNKIRIVGKAIPTGSRYEHTLNIKWTFDNHGKAIRWEATGDVLSLESAFAGISR